MNILLAVIALAAVVFGPLVLIYISKQGAKLQLEIAKRQIRAQTVSASRQAWIDALRNDVAEFMSLAVEAAGRPSLSGKLISQIVLLEQRINLRLNHSEQAHKNLSTLMTATRAHALSVDIAQQDDVEALEQAGNTLQDNILQIRRHTSSIVKQEWDRIKEEE